MRTHTQRKVLLFIPNSCEVCICQMGTPQELPKRLRLVVDVSGSMYRFNGHDSRLTREMEATLMMMEAFENYENKIKVN